MIHSMEIIIMVLFRPVFLHFFKWLKNSRANCLKHLKKQWCRECKNKFDHLSLEEISLVPFVDRIDSFTNRNFHWQEIKIWQIKCSECNELSTFDLQGDFYPHSNK